MFVYLRLFLFVCLVSVWLRVVMWTWKSPVHLKSEGLKRSQGPVWSQFFFLDKILVSVLMVCPDFLCRFLSPEGTPVWGSQGPAWFWFRCFFHFFLFPGSGVQTELVASFGSLLWTCPGPGSGPVLKTESLQQLCEGQWNPMMVRVQVLVPSSSRCLGSACLIRSGNKDGLSAAICSFPAGRAGVKRVRL